MNAVDKVAEVLAAHRVNYHHRNVGGETASTLRYTSCDGCDWLGGWHDEAGWEAHVAAALLASGVVVPADHADDLAAKLAAAEAALEQRREEVQLVRPGVPDREVERFALDADLTVYWPWVRPCWQEPR